MGLQRQGWRGPSGANSGQKFSSERRERQNFARWDLHLTGRGRGYLSRCDSIPFGGGIYTIAGNIIFSEPACGAKEKGMADLPCAREKPRNGDSRFTASACPARVIPFGFRNVFGQEGR